MAGRKQVRPRANHERTRFLGGRSPDARADELPAQPATEPPQAPDLRGGPSLPFVFETRRAALSPPQASWARSLKWAEEARPDPSD